MAGGYNIAQVDVPGILGLYQQTQDRRVQQMLLERKIAAEDRALARTESMSKIYSNLVIPGQAGTQPKGGDPSSGGMSGAYAAPSTPVAPSAPLAAQPGAVAPIASAPWAPASDDPSPATTAPPVATPAAAATAKPPAPLTTGDHGWLASNAGAIQQLMGLDYKEGMALYAHLKSMDDDQRKELVDGQDALHTLAAAVQKLPYGERRAAIAESAPELMRAHPGVTPQMVQEFDPTDQNIQKVIGVSLGIKGMADQTEKAREFSLKERAQTEIERKDRADEANQSWKSVQPGEELHNVGVGGGSSAPGVIPPDAPTSSQLKKLVVQGIPGARITSGQRTAVHNAAVGGVPNSQHITGTALDFVAPGSSLKDVKDYFASKGVNVTVLQHDAGSGMHFHVQAARTARPAESSQGSIIRNSGNATGVLSGPALDQAARVYNMTGNIPANLGRGGVATRAILDRAAELSSGQDVGDLVAGRAGNKADMASLGTLERQATIVRAAEGAAKKNAQLAVELGRAAPRGTAPIFNRWRNAGGHHTGDPNIDKFGAAVETFINEYASVMGKGVPTDSLRAHGHDMLNTAQNQQQFEGTVGVMMRDMANRSAAFDDERKSTMARIKGGGSPSSGWGKAQVVGH